MGWFSYAWESVRSWWGWGPLAHAAKAAAEAAAQAKLRELIGEHLKPPNRQLALDALDAILLNDTADLSELLMESDLLRTMTSRIENPAARAAAKAALDKVLKSKW